MSSGFKAGWEPGFEPCMTELKTLRRFTYNLPPLWAHFTVEETEAQRCNVAEPSSLRLFNRVRTWTHMLELEVIRTL